MAEAAGYTSHLSSQAAALPIGLPRRQQRRILDLADQIALHPFRISDYQTSDDAGHEVDNLLLDDYFRAEIKKCQKGWRNVVASAAKKGIPVPAFSTALAFYDQYRSATLPANLLQAQRDYFGAHTYERVDKPRGQFFHTNWTGRGGSVSSSTYNA